MQIGDVRRITVIGAGLAGTLQAVMLAQRGYRVDLFERFPDARKQSIPAGRSINLALAERGRHALRKIAMLDTVDEFTIPMRGRMLHDLQGQQVLQRYGKDETELIYSTHRCQLNQCLLDAAQATGRIKIYFNHQLTGIDFDQKMALFEDPLTRLQHHHSFNVLIGADGGGSQVRKAMIDGANLGLREEILDHGYRELTIPPDANGDFQLDPNALHIWPRGGFMMIALANPDSSFTVTLFLAKQGDPGFDDLLDWPAQRDFIRQQFPDAYPLLSRLQLDFEENPVGFLGTIHCDRWQINGKVLLIGDAAHAIVPFHGQGMNAAFEDCTVLMNMLDQAPADMSWKELFEDFETQRRPDTRAISEMTLENYSIMRESVRDPKFLLGKKLEHELERRHPDRFIARYSMVMFHRIPYSTVQQRGSIQAGLLDELLTDADTLEKIDFRHAARLIDKSLEPLSQQN